MSSDNKRTRGHPTYLKVTHIKLIKGNASFTRQETNLWNSLPQNITRSRAL